jgi:hypothetical protein
MEDRPSTNDNVKLFSKYVLTCGLERQGLILQEGQRDHTADRFVGVVESVDDRLKKQTVGLVTLEDFQRTRNELEEEQRQVAAKSSGG